MPFFPNTMFLPVLLTALFTFVPIAFAQTSNSSAGTEDVNSVFSQAHVSAIAFRDTSDSLSHDGYFRC